MKKSRTRHTTAPAPQAPDLMFALAAGMADDFNNILTTIMGACSLIDRDDLTKAELLKCTALIQASAEHAADLSGTLMLVATEVLPKKSNLN